MERKNLRQNQAFVAIRLVRESREIGRIAIRGVARRVRKGRLSIEHLCYRDDLMARVESEPKRAIKIYLDSGWPADTSPHERCVIG